MADPVPFAHPQFEPLTFQAERYGPSWNGWATPVVTRDTLESMLDHLDAQHVIGGIDEDGIAYIRYTDDATINEPEKVGDILRPERDGTYDLARLGWTFEQAQDVPPSTEIYLHIGVRLNHAHALTCTLDAVNGTFDTDLAWTYDRTGYSDPARVISGWNSWSEPVGEDANDEVTGHVLIRTSSYPEAATTFRRLLEAGMSDLVVPIRDGTPLSRPTYAALSEIGNYDQGVGELGIEPTDNGPVVVWNRGEERVHQALGDAVHTPEAALPPLPPYPAGWPAPQVTYVVRAGTTESVITLLDAGVRLGVWMDEDGVNHCSWQHDPADIRIPTTPDTFDDLIATGTPIQLITPDGRTRPQMVVRPDPDVVDTFKDWAAAVRARGAALLEATDEIGRHTPLTHQHAVEMMATGRCGEPGGTAPPSSTVAICDFDIDPISPLPAHNGPQIGL